MDPSSPVLCSTLFLVQLSYRKIISVYVEANHQFHTILLISYRTIWQCVSADRRVHRICDISCKPYDKASHSKALLCRHWRQHLAQLFQKVYNTFNFPEVMSLAHHLHSICTHVCGICCWRINVTLIVSE